MAQAFLVAVLFAVSLVGACGGTTTETPCLEADDCTVPCEEFCGERDVLDAACVDEVCECACVDLPAGGCTEDAFDSILVEVTPTDSFDVPSTCPNITETLIRQDATVSVTNTSTTRGIRLGATVVRASDQQTLENGCEANALPGQTVEECIQMTAAGCEGPLAGPSTGAGLILLPGETTEVVPFTCRNQFIFQPPNSNGTCGDALLENVTETWIVQGVYCEPGESADAFCEDIAQTQIRFGQPSSTYQARMSESCP
ncbi:MAG: hypothetical protein AAF500_14750 [Myxococcota bacterium]